MQAHERAAGNYWELDGEPQNRCPRVYLRDHSDDWASYMLSYKAFDSGFLPSAGGMDAQPSLFMPIMTTISAAINNEQELKRHKQQRRAAQLADSKADEAKRKANEPKRFVTLPPAKRG